MNAPDISRYKTPIIIVLIILFSLLALWIRLIPEPALVSDAGVNLLGNDPWYNLRQIEATSANFPGYAWYDPMSLYPSGMPIYWGPLFIQITAFIGILVGASTRPELMHVASLVPPIMATAMVPTMYFLGKSLTDRKTGLIASLFIAVITGQYLYRSLFGFVDHHIAEVLFSTLFCLLYILTLKNSAGRRIDPKDPETFKKPVIFGFIAGIAYVIGLMVMPTMVLFALIVAAFTLVQFIWDFYRETPSDYLLLVNGVIFGTAIIGTLLFGLKHDALSLSRYSIVHVYAYLALILASGILYAFSRYFSGKQKALLPLSVIVTAGVGSLALFLVSPDIFQTLIGGVFQFFGEQAETLTVQEARPWELSSAWSTFNFGFILMAGGIGVVLYKNFRNEHPDHIFVLVWSIVILFSTIRHVRYEYYLAVNIALLSALFIAYLLDLARDDISGLLRGHPAEKDVISQPQKKKKKAATPPPVKARLKNPLTFAVAVAGVILGVLFFSSSLTSSVNIADSVGGGIDSDWMETLRWMEANTPDPGVDYYAIYERSTYQYPDQSYGVISWWDYGHWITFVAGRIPTANPFQSGVSGPDGAAAFFIRASEAESSAQLTRLNARYIITDFPMDDAINGKFWAMATWYNSSLGGAPYTQFLISLDAASGQSEVVGLHTAAYFRTILARLHNFDGSMVEPAEVLYIEYSSKAGMPAPVISNYRILPPGEASAAVAAYNAQAAPGSHAGVFSQLPINPVEKVPALHRYRLVHESPTSVLSGEKPNLQYVKVFEFVPGATIPGEGIIEVDVVTNLGRTFTYRQESENGMFVVPYATSGSPYDVMTTGPYRIRGTGVTIEVPESAVMQGRVIS
ncbi:MAG: oligosaccharyl transferase, archaeosortase A system-associated [Methanomicrobiaceae archaeon]|nr:oligosaccharyl transferase, archaeosortase A system-associated [Methanomicrobiaceae archaeon]